MQFHPEWEDFTGLVAAASMLLLGLWLVYLDPGKRLHRALAWFLFFRAMVLITIRLDESIYSFWGRMVPYFSIAVPFAALYFALIYRARYASPRAQGRPPAWFYGLIALAVVFEILYLQDHTLFYIGPLGVFHNLAYGAFAVIALMFARGYALSPPGPGRRALYVASLAFVLQPAYQSTWQVVETLTELTFGSGVFRNQYTNPFIVAGQLVYVATLAVALAAVWTVYRAPRIAADNDDAKRYETYASLTACAILVAIPLAVLFATVQMQYITLRATHLRPLRDLLIGLHRTVDGLWTLAIPTLTAYAVLRHQLFDLDVRARFVVKQGTLAGSFFAVFFIVSEGLQTLIENMSNNDQLGQFSKYSPILGVLGAGVFVFATHPLHRFAERLSQRTVPHGKPLADMTHPERLELYREQTELAWLDGHLERKERLLLDTLRARLGLSEEEGAQIERAAVEGALVPRTPRFKVSAVPSRTRRAAPRASAAGGTPRKR